MQTNFHPHAEKRIRQRGRKESDIDFVLAHGTLCNDGVILSGKDVDKLVADCKRTIDKATKLKNTYVALKGDTVITAFPATKRQQRRKLAGK